MAKHVDLGVTNYRRMVNCRLCEKQSVCGYRGEVYSHLNELEKEFCKAEISLPNWLGFHCLHYKYNGDEIKQTAFKVGDIAIYSEQEYEARVKIIENLSDEQFIIYRLEVIEVHIWTPLIKSEYQKPGYIFKCDKKRGACVPGLWAMSRP